MLEADSERIEDGAKGDDDRGIAESEVDGGVKEGRGKGCIQQFL